MLKHHGLSIVVFGLFLIFLVAESVVGRLAYNEEQKDHGQAPVSYFEYIRTGEFIESTTENWESEFLEMAAYVIFTAMLFQKGSAESRKMGEPEPSDRDPRLFKARQDAPWPVRRGGWVLRVYENSLSIAFFALFLLAFVIHAASSLQAYNADQLEHGGATLSFMEFLSSSRLWFQSFQNWQSEFLGLGSMIVLSIFLRQRGSPESKPVDAAHSQTGKD